MAYKVVFSFEAEEERNLIVEYLIEVLCNRQAAQHFMDALDEALSVVCATPELYAFSKEPRLANLGYRPCLFMNYVALCKIDDEEIKVAHIFHSSQDYARLV